MNPAERFMQAFPNAAESNGWSRENLLRLVKDATRLGLTGDDCQGVIEGLLRTTRRTTVPQYPEVFRALRDRANRKYATAPDPLVVRHREWRERWTPPTPEQKAARAAWLAAFRAGDREAMDKASRAIAIEAAMNTRRNA